MHEISDREIGRIALAVISKFFPGLKGGNIRYGELFAAITAALKHGADQVFVLPSKATEQNCHLAALVGSEGPFDRAMEMRRLVESCNLAQAHAFRCEALLDFRIILNLDEIRSHKLLRRGFEF